MHDHPATKTCPGPCNNAWRRAEAALTETGEEHFITPAWGQPVQCGACVERSRHQVSELPELLVAVQLEALHGTPLKLAGTIGRVGAPNWPGQAARLLLDRILGEMTELQADILVQRGIWTDEIRPEPVSEGHLISGTTSTLLAHWDWAMQHHPAATEPHTAGNANPGGQAANWYRAAQFFTRRDNPRIQMAAPCPRCHLKTLSHSNGESYISCRNPECEVLLSRQEYDQHTKEVTGAIIIDHAA
ncbi:hypothetical protein MUK60_07370 [Streptomyces sp. LRE541]|uniref:hypothetical protein n=1 Tax=Streptomyces sp. LRE541 TaxID=2931983 RepID=UPI00200BA1D9|nr:hypothetical protein [Streptomyces sp. LRE541]UPZ27652.1 hypothetical protein MUK60_07370 [Streptomyces sp. LRE541]